MLGGQSPMQSASCVTPQQSITASHPHSGAALEHSVQDLRTDANDDSMPPPPVVGKLAGQEGIEPPTPGFGDRCSAN